MDEDRDQGPDDDRRLRLAIICAGLAWSVTFIVVGLGYDLEFYGDGSIFAYAVAVEDSWAFHWHNISGRLFVYLYSHLPAETYVHLTGDAAGGIALHALLFFSAPMCGLAATYAADRSPGQMIFVGACLSTALLCPLVFGFPTEMWVAHSVFWPTLAVAHHARAGIGDLLVASGFAALVLSHGGGVVLALAIVVTLVPRGLPDRLLKRSLSALVVAIAGLALTLWSFRPDPYIGRVIATAAFSFIDLRNLLAPAALLLAAALAAHVALAAAARWLGMSRPDAIALSGVSAALLFYWCFLDEALSADYRYPLRTALLAATPVLGGLAALLSLGGAGRHEVPLVNCMLALGRRLALPRVLLGGLAIVVLVHGVETTKFVTAWRQYEVAVRALAMSHVADASLGHPAFVSSARLGDALNRLAWSSTTHFLSILVAPGLAPSRLVVSPDPAYWWLSCKVASANAAALRAVPVASRRLVQDYACAR